MGRRRKKAPAAAVGFDVGKSFHWAFGVGAGGEAVLSERVDNRPASIDRVLAEAGAGALVFVDQRRNIGALVLARARRGYARRLPAREGGEAGPRDVPGDGQDRRAGRGGDRADGARNALDAARGPRGGRAQGVPPDALVAARVLREGAHRVARATSPRPSTMRSSPSSTPSTRRMPRRRRTPTSSMSSSRSGTAASTTTSLRAI